MTALPIELPAGAANRDLPFLTDTGLFEWTVAKWDFLRRQPDRLTAIFWAGGRECLWLPASTRGSAPTLHQTYDSPEDAERAFFAVYPEYQP